MSLIAAICSPWAITPAAFSNVVAVVNRHFAGEHADLTAIQAALGRPLSNQRRELQVVDGTALITLDGVLARSMNLLTDISGGTSTQVVGNQLREALASSNVKNIVLRVNSPGGTVDGTTELADSIYAARAIKPIFSIAEGPMTSAAYWIGSSASRVFASSPNAEIGSIGVVAIHYDTTGRQAQLGVKTSEISAGRYKRIASDGQPLSAEGRAYIQDRIDYHYSIFVDAVARNRGASSDQVLSNMAEGQVFIGQRAVDAGLIDGIKTLDQVMAEINAAGGAGNGGGTAPASGPFPAGATAAPSGNATAPPAASADYATRVAHAKSLQTELATIGMRVSVDEAHILAAGGASSEPANIALHAKVYQAREKAKGRQRSAVEAVNHVMKERGLG